MKRYLLFRFAGYYPGGGWNDFEISFDTDGDAIRYLAANQDGFRVHWHIVDSTTGKIILSDTSI